MALVFLPVFLLGGVPGALFRPLATAYVLATLASLGVALTVTPTLAAALLPRAIAAHPTEPGVPRALRSAYRRALAGAIDHPALVALAGLAAVGAAALTAPFLHLEFLPEFHETDFAMRMTGAPGIGLDESARVGAAVGHTLLAIPGVQSVAQVIGRAPLSEDPWQAERSEPMVRLAPDADVERATEAARAAVAGVAGFAFDLKQFLNERIEELLGGSGAGLVVRLRGTDLDSLDTLARDLVRRIAAVPDAVDVHAPGALTAPSVRIAPRRFDLLRYGVPAAALQRAMRAAFGGLVVGRVAVADRHTSVVLRLDSERARPRTPGRATDPTGASAVPLGSIADVGTAALRTAIAHEDGVRTIAIRIDSSGRPLADVARDVEKLLDSTALPPGTYAELGGELEAARAAERRLLGIGALSLVGVLILLLADFGSLRLAILALVKTPLAFAGGILAVALGTGGRLSLGAIVGFVTVFGITMRNGIVLIAHLQHESRARGRPLTRPEIVAAAADRLGPILMTALVTGIALLPLLAGVLVNALAVAVLVARIMQSLVHVCFVQTDAVASVRFVFFFVQIASFLWLTEIVLTNLR